ncbi:MAG: DUF1648 domain-containing protein [Raoultibacter sp.]
MSRAKTIMLVVIALFPVLLTAITFPFLPDMIAFHFNSMGVDQWKDKAMLFLPSGILSVLSLFIVWLCWASQHKVGPGKEPLIITDRDPMSFSLCACVLGGLDLLLACYIGYNLLLHSGAPTTFPGGSVVTWVVVGLTMLVMFGTAAYFLTGKAARWINGHPGITKREEEMGDDKAQSRAIGFLFLFLSFVTLAMLLAPSLMRQVGQ